MKTYLILLLIWNIIVMFTYGIDKLNAKRGKRRIREATLLLIAFLFGGIGAIFGMVLFNHKTSKIKFRICVPIFVVLNAILIFLINSFFKLVW